MGGDGKPYRNARNLAAGSIRSLSAETCKERKINFFAFNVLEGMDETADQKDSRSQKLLAIEEYGFEICPFLPLSPNVSEDELETQINTLLELAEASDIPIDGMVVRFDSLSYSRVLDVPGTITTTGWLSNLRTIPTKPSSRSIEWQTGRTGEIAPVAVFDAVEIDGCDVSRASLHNVSFIKNLELHPGCRILVSKRNMIIPHIEENLDRGAYENMLPETCPLLRTAHPHLFTHSG